MAVKLQHCMSCFKEVHMLIKIELNIHLHRLEELATYFTIFLAKLCMFWITSKFNWFLKSESAFTWNCSQLILTRTFKSNVWNLLLPYYICCKLYDIELIATFLCSNCMGGYLGEKRLSITLNYYQRISILRKF